MSQFQYLYGSTSNADPVVVSGNSNAVNMAGLSSGQITAVVTDLTPSAGTFTAVAATDVCTLAANGFGLGQIVQVSNSGGALPTGLSASTNYYAIPINGDTFYLATSYANAAAGTKIDITGAGSGTNTVTPTALAGGTGTLQGAQVNQSGAVIASTWANISNTAQTISGLGVFNFLILNADYAAYRLAVTGNTAGTLGLVVTFTGRS